MCNICRPFLLYSDYLPPDTESHNWDYMSFGYYDGIHVGENLFDGGIQNYEVLWKYACKRKKELDGKFSEQIIFGFCTGNVQEEQEFWNREYPFLFLVFLQVEKGELQSIWEKKYELEQYFSESDEKEARVYLTLDSSDLLLAIRCKRYTKGAKTIDMFHRYPQNSIALMRKIVYSFTIASVSKKYIGQGSSELGNDKVYEAHIYMIERKPGSIEGIIQKLGENGIGKYIYEGSKKSVLGCNDELLILKDIPWNDFLNLYKDKDLAGIFNHSSDHYSNYFTCVTTIIAENQKEIPIDNNGKMTDAADNKLAEKAKSYKKQMVKSLKDKCKALDNDKIIQELNPIINALQKFNEIQISDYIFIPVLKPLEMLMQILIEYKDKDAAYDRIVMSSFYKFLKGFNLYAQNSIKSDRQFNQTLDFNVRIYNTPVKMNAFYNAFIFKVKKFLACYHEEGVKHAYEFLACPGLVVDMRVEELFLFVSEKSKLFMVNIPEKQVYEPIEMMLMLGHEIGHFVGRKLRNRENRNTHIHKILSICMVAHFKKGIFEYWENRNSSLVNDDAIENYWCDLEEKINELLLQCNGSFEEKSYLNIKFEEDTVKECYFEDMEWMRKFMKLYKYHGKVLNVTLTEKMMDIFRIVKIEFFSYLIDREKLDEIGDGGELTYTINKLIEEAVNFSDLGMEHSYIKALVEEVVSLFKECVADLIAILTLEVPLEDYLNTIIKGTEDQPDEPLDRNFMNIRILLVVHCLLYTEKNKELGFGWERADLDKYKNNHKDPKKIKLIERVREGLQDFFIDQRESLFDLYNSRVLDEFSKYLLKCREIFEKGLLENKERQEELRNVYQIFKKKNTDENILELQKFLDSYQKEIFSESE